MGGTVGKYLEDSLTSDSGSGRHVSLLPNFKGFVNRDKEYITRCLKRFRAGVECPGVGLKQFRNVFGGNNGITMAMFEGFDTDRNKLVDLHECFAVLVLTAKLPVVTRLRLLFELHDENGDDELSKLEIEIMMLSCLRGMAKMIGNYVMSEVKINALSEFIFTSIDRDHSHSISREEFIVFCKNSPEVSTYFSKVDEMRTETAPIVTANNKLADFRKSQAKKKARPIQHPPFNRGACGKTGRATLPYPSHNDLTITTSAPSPRLSPIPPNSSAPSKRSKRIEAACSPRGAGSLGSGGGTMDVELLRQIFSGIDENMDGVIDVGEFYLSLKSTSLEDSALALFNKVDKDKNGQLTIHELIQHLFPFAEEDDIENILAWVKNGESSPAQIFTAPEAEAEYRALFRFYDKNGDRKLTVKEIAAVMAETNNLDKKECEKLFIDLGKTKRDVIKEDEFVEMLKMFIEGDDFGEGGSGPKENHISDGLRKLGKLGSL
ncbi:hypothetical protein TrVE_jg14248 [Triparma verrucosa]|uniref:EF-hand domain-containing protein n=1 Tax=Triparma verrucosa TaxID=1606542 RepID=A0A9W7C2U9_9STRA|nr:hypothetical protein TrVE_jg14248 [Triparma verrucosa]